MPFLHIGASKIESVRNNYLHIMNKEVKSKSSQQDCVTARYRFDLKEIINYFLTVFSFW